MPFYEVTDQITGEKVAIEATNKNVAVNAIVGARFSASVMTAADAVDYVQSGKQIIRSKADEEQKPVTEPTESVSPESLTQVAEEG